VPKISDFPVDTEPTSDDIFMFIDTSQGRNEKITFANLATALGLSSGGAIDGGSANSDYTGITGIDGGGA
jgi:hypothetical protein